MENGQYKELKEKNKTNKNPGVLRLIADAFAQIFGTIKKIATKDKKVGLFLVCLLYTSRCV